MERFLAEITPGTWNHEMDLGKPFAQAIAERAVLHPQHAELLGEWKSQWERMLGGAIDESVTLLAELRQAGYRIAALTNWSAETFPVARERFPFLGWFEDIVISGVEGIAKPDPAMFALALQRTGFVAERTVFIDDNLPNIEGARAIGMHTVHFSSTAAVPRRTARPRRARVTASLPAFASAAAAVGLAMTVEQARRLHPESIVPHLAISRSALVPASVDPRSRVIVVRSAIRVATSPSPRSA